MILAEKEALRGQNGEKNNNQHVPFQVLGLIHRQHTNTQTHTNKHSCRYAHKNE